jgi:hypothetical protein
MTTATIAEIALPTAAHIADLFREHDVLPYQLVYLDPPGSYAKCRACAIGILLVEIRGSAAAARADCRRTSHTVFQALREASGLPREFLDGLDNGFTNSDGGEYPDEEEDIDAIEALYSEGYRVGWEAWSLAHAGAESLAEALT